MARKLVLRRHQVITSESMASSITSESTNVENLDHVAYQLIWTGTPTGSVTVEGTVDGSTWTTVTLDTSISASGSADDALIVLNNLPFVSVRVVYTASSGSGTLNAYISGKTGGA